MTVSLMTSPAEIVMPEGCWTAAGYQSNTAVRERNGETSDECIVKYLLTTVFRLTIGSKIGNDTGHEKNSTFTIGGSIETNPGDDRSLGRTRYSRGGERPGDPG